jgi:predicted O-methyltransferase YrrM
MNRFLDPWVYYSKVRRTIYKAFLHDPKRVADGARATFEARGLDETGARLLLNDTLRGLGKLPFDPELDSVHWLLFAAIALKGEPIRRILELGTFEAATTAILGRLFPQAEIVTVDLPESDPLLRAYYNRKDDARYTSFLEKQRDNLALAPKARSIKLNSLFLLDAVTGPFDLIWVDAGHHYPEVAWDTCSALHLCRAGGLLLFDDVICQKRPYKDAYVSTDVFEVLRYLQERRDGALTYFLKRRSPDTLAMTHAHKYVAWYRKP